MQARRQRRPRQTPTMMPVTECTSKESGGEKDRAIQGQKGTVVINPEGLDLPSAEDCQPQSHDLGMPPLFPSFIFALFS